MAATTISTTRHLLLCPRTAEDWLSVMNMCLSLCLQRHGRETSVRRHYPVYVHTVGAIASSQPYGPRVRSRYYTESPLHTTIIRIDRKASNDYAANHAEVCQITALQDHLSTPTAHDICGHTKQLTITGVAEMPTSEHTLPQSTVRIAQAEPDGILLVIHAGAGD